MRRLEAERPMRAVSIVMVHEDSEDMFEVRQVQDQQPVETLGANGPHEPLRHSVGLRGAKRRANDLDPTAAKYIVKSVGEFLVPITDQEADRSEEHTSELQSLR